MSTDMVLIEDLDCFYSEGWITGDSMVVKSGKEATVYCCEGAPRSGLRYLAAKVYRTHRSFRNDAVYQAGRVILSSRIRRAVAKKTGMGQEARSALWIDHEYQCLKQLHAAGADVPRPVARGPNSILMEYVGEPGAPASPLQSVRLEAREARALFHRLVENLRLMLGSNVIHADLSPFNILYEPGRIRVIDFPQAVDPRFSPHAWELLCRDLENVCRYFERQGVKTDPERLASDLWTQYTFAML